MTDMNISDGAVDAAAEHTPVDKHGQFIAPDWDSILDTVRAIDAANVAYGFGPRCSETAKIVEAEIDCALALINEARP